MAFQTVHDIPVLVSSENASSERRITPSWTISQLKAKLEPMTGIPPSSQQIFLRHSAETRISVAAADEDITLLDAFPFAPYVDLQVVDLRPPNARPNFNDPSVEKYVMPSSEYEKKTDSVLAWKRSQKLGRFNPNAPSLEQSKVTAIWSEIDSRGIAVGKRCRIGGEDARRGTVRFLGDVPDIRGSLGPWVGVELDEPVGKNDGSVNGTKYFEVQGGGNCGLFTRPDRVEIGDWGIVDDFDEDLEEI